MTLVHLDDGVAGPATHALVIGIGEYPYLLGGGAEPKAIRHENMRQLTSPPISARAVTDWLLGPFHNPDRPLKSVELVLGSSDLAYSPPTPPGAGAAEPKQVAWASLDAIIAAAVAWKQRGDEHPDNLMLFYFCGHGISKGSEFALVAGDYGRDRGRPLTGLISFPEFLIGMADCKAAHQCYFVDACRVTSERLVEAGNYGDPLVQKIDASTPHLAQCVYYSTLGGDKAHGLKRRPSLYTDALLKALNGAGASNSSGEWRVNTSRLFEALGHLMRELVETDFKRVQIPQSGTQVLFDIHYLPGEPELPFLIGVGEHCGKTPPGNVERVAFARGGQVVSGYPTATPPYAKPCNWSHRHFETWLEAGSYDVELRRTDAPPLEKPFVLHPPGMFLRRP